MTRHQYGIAALFLKRHFEEKPVVASRNIDCFLMLFKILACADCLEPDKDTGLLPLQLFVHHQVRLRVKEILMPYGSNEQQTEEVLPLK